MRRRKPAGGDAGHLPPASGVSGHGRRQRHGPFTFVVLDLPLGYRSNKRSGNRHGPVSVQPDVSNLDWTDRAKVCDPAEVTVTDPMLVVRRHVDLLRVRSAICRLAR